MPTFSPRARPSASPGAAGGGVDPVLISSPPWSARSLHGRARLSGTPFLNAEVRRRSAVLLPAPALVELEQLGKRRRDRAHDPNERGEAGIHLAALDRRDITATHAGAVGDRGLREPMTLAQLGQRGAELSLLCWPGAGGVVVVAVGNRAASRTRDACPCKRARTRQVDPVSGRWTFQACHRRRWQRSTLNLQAPRGRGWRGSSPPDRRVALSRAVSPASRRRTAPRPRRPRLGS